MGYAVPRPQPIKTLEHSFTGTKQHFSAIRCMWSILFRALLWGLSCHVVYLPVILKDDSFKHVYDNPS